MTVAELIALLQASLEPDMPVRAGPGQIGFRIARVYWQDTAYGLPECIRIETE